MSGREKVLALDLDGVLHPGLDPVHFNTTGRMPIFQVEVAMRAQGRFVWLSLLEDALRGSDLSVVVHSTWRRRFSDAELKYLLGPEIGPRVISLDGLIADRLNSTADEYLMQAIELIQPLSVCVLDDRPEFFQEGHVAKWIEANSGALIWTSPQLGISDPADYAELRLWVQTPADGSRPASAELISTPSN